ncbi:MAG TPA: M15 family metallopeptidase [Actinomycetes bacterium]
MGTATARATSERELVALAIEAGKRDVNDLTNLIFYGRHPEMTGRRIAAGQRDLAGEWLAIRDRIVRPALAATTAPPGTRAARRLRSTQWLRSAWSGYECAGRRMVEMRILGRPPTPVNARTTAAFAALERALRSTGYRPRSVWNYNCRDIKGQPGSRSLHAYGLALDIDPDCNPHRRGARSPARFSRAATQQDRCRDVRAEWADTSFTPEQVAAVEAIRTVDGLQVFAWGGRWTTSPDPMHFQINVSPGELARGIA